MALTLLICGFALMCATVALGESSSDLEQASETLTQRIDRLASKGMTELSYFISNYSPREYYSAEEAAAAEYIEGKMRGLSGYTVTVQPFVYSDSHSRPVSSLSLVSPSARDVRSQILEGSSLGDVTAPLAAVGEALESDVPETGLSGKIALIERGSISFAEQVARVAGSGAVGAIIFDSDERIFKNEQPFSGTLIEEDSMGSNIPAAGIWREEGVALLNALNEGAEVRARLKVANEKWASQNIIVEKLGTDSEANVLVVGAHYDTNPNLPGASDNGTGVVSLMVMAEEISSLQLAHTVRFIFFGAEEDGLDGSKYYVESLSLSERNKILAMINLTSLGSGKPAVKARGSTVLVDWVINTYAQENSIEIKNWGPQYGFSDHYYFYKLLGVPNISFHGDNLSLSNTAADVIGSIDSSLMGTQMAIALELTKQASGIAPPPTPKVPAPFTANLVRLPEGHDGENVFKVYLLFSHDPDDLSRQTVRNGLLHVGGADITDARSLFGMKSAWVVTAAPTRRGDITFRLPVRDCSDTTAVCESGRKLSNEVREIVPGPDSPATPPANSLATGAPTIGGSAQVGETLAADLSGIADADGLTNASFGHQWLADDAAVVGATSSTYTVVAADVGKVLTVTVSFTDDAGNEESVTSAETAAVAARNYAASGAPTITGLAQVGGTLTANTSGISDSNGLTNATYTYQWLADDDEISGATSASYALVAADEGKAITVRVTFTDDAGNEESVTSAETAAVAAAPPQEPPPSPTNLTVTTNADGHLVLSWDAPADDSVTGYRILRRRPSMGENTLQVYVSDTQSTSTTYTDTNVTADVLHVYRVKSINAAGQSGRSNFVNVTPQAPQGQHDEPDQQSTQEAPPAPTNLTAKVNASRHVVLSWNAPTDDSVTGYQILRRRPSLGEDTLRIYESDTGSTATTFTDTNVTAGLQHVYRVKAINAAGRSGRSNFVNVTPQG